MTNGLGMWRRYSLTAVGATMILSSACGATLEKSPSQASAPASAVSAADPEAQMRPDLIVATPARVQPEAIVELRFPRGTLRGLGFALEQNQEQAWSYRYQLVSDRGGGPPNWQEANKPGGWEVDLVAITGPGPDRIQLPPIAPPGDYRICTMNAAPNFCTSIAILQAGG